MVSSCKSCGASAPARSGLMSFVCEYCGTKNVDEEYFKIYATKVDTQKAGRLLQLGLIGFSSGNYADAEKHLEASALEDINNPEVWIYLSLCKAQTVKASHFNKNFRAAKDCFERAMAIDSNSELVVLGGVELGNRFLAASVKSAKYYFDTASKKYFALGENKDAAKAAVSESQSGLEVLKTAYELNPTDFTLIARTCSMAVAQCMDMEEKRAPKDSCSEFKSFFAARLRGLYEKRPNDVSAIVREVPVYGTKIGKELAATSAVKSSGKIASSQESNSASIISPSPIISVQKENKSINTMALSVVGVVIVASVGYFLFRPAAPTQILDGVVATKAIAEPVPAAPAESAPIITIAPSQVVPLVTTPPSDVVSSSSTTAPEPAPTQKDDLVSPNFDVKGKSETKQILLSMLKDSLSSIKLAEAKGLIEQQPKPQTGDRKAARALNEKGLQALKLEKYSDAINLFQQSVSTDESDVEIRNNFGYALLKAKKYDEAEEEIGMVLSYSPGRSSAWANLAEIYASKGAVKEAASALIVTFQFSSNKDKTLTFLKEKSMASDIPAFQEASKIALAKLSN